jgi:8-oxo-dGTP pyrophosphatase MutT (NUDIX family)
MAKKNRRGGRTSTIRKSDTRVAVQTPVVIEQAMDAAGMNGAVQNGPGRPLNPYQGYSTRPRSTNYPVGVNIATQTRAAWHRPSFETIDNIIGAYDVARMCINHKIDELRSMELLLQPADGVRGDLSDAVAAARLALVRPDRELLFSSWLSKWLESCLKYDAGTLYRRRDRAGRVIGLEVLDGATISPYIDENGRRPAPPQPAYGQIIQGQVRSWYTSDDIIYTPYRPQGNSPFGLAPIESILLTANTDIRFQWWFLQSFTEGSIPAAYGEAPPDQSSPDQVAEWQDYWDAVIEGDQSQQHKVKWVPAGTKIQPIRENNFDSAFPEYLMARTCAMYGVVPQDLGLVKDVNRANGETQTDIQFRVNTLPWVNFVQDHLNDYIQNDLGLPVKAALDTGRDKADRYEEARAMQLYVDMGALSPDEVRSNVHGLPIDNERPTPRFFSSKLGPIPLLAIEGIAGLTDEETYGPSRNQPVLYKPFAPAIGVLPMAGTTDHAASLAEVDATQVSDRQQLAAVTAPTGGLTEPITKETTAGVTVATGITGNPMAAAKLVRLPPYSAEEDEDEDDDEGATFADPAKELAAFGRFTKARAKVGRWRDFSFSALDATSAHRLNDHGRAQVRKDAGQVVAAGLCVRALDSGRVLMLQRSVDPDDPASGTWEFPGGHVETGETARAAAVREWQEETGVLLPVESMMSLPPEPAWASGVYAGFVLDVPSESMLNTAGDQVTNPDDPDGDVVEALAWTDPSHLPGWPALRPELAGDLDAVLPAISLPDTVVKSDPWSSHPGRAAEAKLVPYHAEKIGEALGKAITASDIRSAVVAYMAANGG